MLRVLLNMALYAALGFLIALLLGFNLFTVTLTCALVPLFLHFMDRCFDPYKYRRSPNNKRFRN